jgi:hypothetical protein
MNDPSQDRPTLWIALSAILALAAIVLGIWALNTKSDLDDANEKVENAERRNTAERAVATRIERSERLYGKRQERAYRRVRRQLVGAQAEAEGLHKAVNKEAKQLKAARRATANAEGEAEKREAELNEARQEADLAAACARGATDALNRFFQAATAQQGARKAVKQLQRQQSKCREVVG